ncbi:CHAT domain-containing protein [Micromonospora sp. B006]|uniref:CHAT domain-containing protein n=1 Tax=Micromonospora sp. B006 TaxID=2201999 RepID=UPI0012601305|nr:CHAT domain-containing protein [Micromonospora sp. B006]
MTQSDLGRVTISSISAASAAEHARRGIWRLESYEFGLDGADLGAAIEELTFATEHADDHPQRSFWCYCRAVAHAYRFDDGAGDELAVAIAWGERAFTDAAEIDRPPFAVFLGELYWSRYAQYREAPEVDRHLDTHIEALTAMQLDGPDPLATAQLRLMLGAAHAERFQRSGGRSDLDAAITLLEASVDDLPADAPEVATGALLLCSSYRARSEQDERFTDWDLAIQLADRTAARLEPAEEPRVINLRWVQYLFLCQRLERADDHLDRDEAIRCLRHAVELSAEPDPELAMALAELLGDRGELYENAEDMASSAVWAGVAANAGTDPKANWYPRLWQADCYLALWAQRGDVDDLAHLLDALSGAIDAGLPDPDMRLTAHRDRLKGRHDLDQRRVAAGEVGEREAAAARVPLVLAADEQLRLEPGGRDDVRSDLAALLAAQMVALVGEGVLEPDMERLRELLTIARRHAPDQHRQQLLSIVESTVEIHRADDDGGGYGMKSLAEALEMPEFDTSTTSELRQMMSVAKFVRGSRTGDMRDLDSAMSGLYHAHRDATSDPARSRHLKLFLTFTSLIRADAGDDPIASQAELDRADRLMTVINTDAGPAGPLETLLSTALRVPRMIRDGAGPAELAKFVDSLPSGESMSGGLSGYRVGQMIRFVKATASVVAAYNHGKPAEMSAAGQAFVQAVDGVNAGRPVRTRTLNIAVSQALDLLDRHSDPAVAEAALRWAEENVTNCAHPSDQAWASAWLNLARMLRRRSHPDDLVRSRAYALSALRGRTWQIVLQHDVDYGLIAARRRAGDVRLAARWCREDVEMAEPLARQSILAELVQALDAGRGLVLGVAAAAGAVHEALVAGGEVALAELWLAGERFDHPHPQFDPADLRHRVVEALARDAEADLFAPVTADEIRAALVTADRDALVYLVASDTTAPGYAVVVGASGDIDLLPLPALRIDGSPLGWYLHTYHGVQVLTGGDVEAWRWSLSQLSSWAWKAGMGTLVDHCRTIAPDDRPKLVLVPTGALAAVPWHAAWRLVDGAERRYAIQDVTISYAASARTWSDAVTRPPVTPPGEGPVLIIADPTGTLPSAADEAGGIRRSFYPDATYLGRPASSAAGTGTPAEVLGWLAAADAPPAAVLHAACHGVVEPDRPSQSHLRLDGGPLRADDLVRLAVAHRRIGTVVLAACTTNVAGDEYDEALTLSTAFLIAGADSVVGSLWAVPSASTALLMFMFHHFLRDTPGDPGEALRLAQLWMLNPRRPVPAGAADLARQVDPERLGEPYRWAGFAHLG